MSAGTVAIGTLAVALIGAVIAIAKLLPEIRQMRATTHRSNVDAAVARDEREDEHLALVIRTQAEFMLAPLKDDLVDLRSRVRELEAQVQSMRVKYKSALSVIRTHVRHVVALAGILNDHSIQYPAPPSIPNDIADDL